MTKPIGNSDFSLEATMEGIDKILTSIEQGYGLSRSEAVNCLHWMSIALEELRPGDVALEARFHQHVEDAVNDSQPWAEKVSRAILSWGDAS